MTIDPDLLEGTVCVVKWKEREREGGMNYK